MLIWSSSPWCTGADPAPGLGPLDPEKTMKSPIEPLLYFLEEIIRKKKGKDRKKNQSLIYLFLDPPLLVHGRMQGT